MPATRIATASAVLLTALGLAACGSSGDDGSSTSTSTATSGGTPATSTSAAASSSASGGKVVDATGGKVTIDAKDFSFDASEIRAKAGKLTVSMKNMGMAPHEFVLIKTTKAPDSFKITNGRVSEKGSVGEISEISGGKTMSHTFDLKKGRYVYICNVPGHYGDGMRGELVVS